MNENNNVRQSLEAFRDKIQARVKERMNRPSMTEALHEQNKQKAEKKSPWFAEFKTDRATYVIMAVSAIFTAILGLILGLAPEMRANPDGSTYIYFHTDFLHLAIAVIYAVAFVTVTEAAFLIAKNKFHTREEANPTQHNTMLAMMILAGLSIIGTGIAGSTIGASVLGFLTDFKEIPHAAQKWVVGVIPVLLAVYAYFLTAYKLSSEEEKSNRLTEQMKIQQQREHKLQRDLAELEVQEMMMLAEDKAYLEAVERGVLTAADVAAAKRAGKTLRQLETEKGTDLDGDGMVGQPVVLNRPLTYHPAPQAAPVSNVLSQYAWKCEKCGENNYATETKCFQCGESRTNSSPVVHHVAVSHSGKNGQNP
jgi:hypothetical protein